MKNSLKQLWLTFTQAVTILLALILVIRLYVPSFPNNFTNKKVETPAIIAKQEALPQQHITRTPTDSYSLAASKASPSVVNIYTTKKAKARPNIPLIDDPLFQFFFGEQLKKFEGKRKPESSLGSGVIVNANGLILTNNHVITMADDIEVALTDGRKLAATVVGTDPETDLALIKVEATALPAITFASSEVVNVGDVVLAIGNPFGVGQTVTQGIVSALGRSHLGINTFENFIQTDASINPGNSGGALINTNGELVGVNSAIYSKSGGSMGIGFAIPASLAKQVLDQIATNGKVTRGWVGIEVQDITPELAESFSLQRLDQGALISRVLEDGPAYNAGLRPGDILMEINGKPVFNSDKMLNLIASLTPNKATDVKVLRNGESLSLSILIGIRPKPSN
jgi:serine protease DegQ